MKIKVAEYIAEFFIRHNITDCFMVTGGGAMHLNDALGHQKGLRCIFNHHEQACAMAAEGYARMSGRLPAVCVTSGPGGTNALTGVMGAWMDSIPMFVISGQVKREMFSARYPALGLRQLGDQEFDIVSCASNMTKYAVRLLEAEEAAYHMEKALYLAGSGRGGPVWIDIPLDVQSAWIETDALRHFDPEKEHIGQVPEASSHTAAEILEKIRNAKAPLILAGTGIRLGSAYSEFLQLLEKLQVPAVTAWNANDLVAFDHPLFAGMPGTVGTRAGNFAVQNCDLLLSLGCRMNIRMIGYNRYEFAENAYKIIVDIDEKELHKPTVKPDLAVHADVKQLILELLKQSYTPSAWHKPWTEWCRSLVETYQAEQTFQKPACGKLNPYAFMGRLFDRLEEEDRIVCGNGSACVVTFQAAKIRQGQRMFTNSGCASMGYGLPAAIGAAVSDRSRRVICVEGDGSIMMNMQELATAAYHALDLKIFLLNNNGYHSIRQTQANLFQPPFIGIDADSGVGFPDFGKLADAFGIPYFRLDREEHVAEVLDSVLGSRGICICEVLADPAQGFAPKTASRTQPDGSMASAALDDMYPFLDREELAKIRYGGKIL